MKEVCKCKWVLDDKFVFVDMKSEGKSYMFLLKIKDVVGFGDFIVDRLSDLY